MSGEYLSAKPVRGQVLESESPSEKTEDRRAPPTDTPTAVISSMPGQPSRLRFGRLGADGKLWMTDAEKDAFFGYLADRKHRGAKRPVTSPPDEAASSPSIGSPASSVRAHTGGRPRKREDPDDEPITRGYVAQILGVDVSTVRRLEARGQLHPKIGRGGVRYFEMHEVRRMRAHRLRLLRSQRTEVKLAAFVLFRKGIDWRDVAIKLQYDPVRVYRLWRLYAVQEETDDKSGR